MQHWVVMLLIIEKVTYQVLMEIISTTIYFSNLFAFQIRVSNVVPVHHSSFGLYSHSCLKVTYRVLMEIMSASIDFNLFGFQIRVVVEVMLYWFLYIILHLASSLTFLSTLNSTSTSASVASWMDLTTHIFCLRSPHQFLQTSNANNICDCWIIFVFVLYILNNIL